MGTITPPRRAQGARLRAIVWATVGVLALGGGDGWAQSAGCPSHLLAQSEALTLHNPDSALLLANMALNLAFEGQDLASQMRAELQIGFVHYTGNRFDRALEHFHRSLNIARHIHDPRGEGIALNRLGNAQQLKANYPEALAFYTQALGVNRQHGIQAEEARTLVNLATAYSDIGHYQRSIELFLEAMRIHEAQGEREGMAWGSLGVARLFNRLNVLPRAMEHAQTALRLYQALERETGHSTGVTLSLNEIGSIYHRQGNLARAREYTLRVLGTNRRNANIHGQAANHLSLGVIYLDERNTDSAYHHLHRALALKQQVADSIDMPRLLRYLGEVYIRRGSPSRGLSLLRESLEYAQRQRLVADASESYLALSRAHAQMGNYRLALQAYTNYSAFRDSLNLAEIAQLEMRHEFEKRHREHEVIAQQREAMHRLQLDRQRGVILFFVLAFLLAGSLAVFIFQSYRAKQRINRILVGQNAEITRQKFEIQSQKEEIEQQRDYVTRQRDQIAEQQRLITDSITYASRIQSAVLPSPQAMRDFPWEHFVFYRPKNIVSGDFYWVARMRNGRILMAVADCTGHGVPGAFMSMLGITLIRELAENEFHLSPAQMLQRLRTMMMAALNQQPRDTRQADGMDVALTLIDPTTLELEYAGAYLPAIIIRQGHFEAPTDGLNPRILRRGSHSLLEFRGNKMPIGPYIGQHDPFAEHRIALLPGDSIYLFSDGYADQFGGPKGNKFLLQQLKHLLLQAQELPINRQRELLARTIEEFQGGHKQVDDMIVIGVKIAAPP